MSTSNHFNNSFSGSNITSIDSNNSLNDNNIKYSKICEDNNFNCIKNEVFDIDEEEDNLSQFSGFSYNKNYDPHHDHDKLEQTLVSNELSGLGSDLDSDLDFMFDYDIIYNIEQNSKFDYIISEIKHKVKNKIKLDKKDLMYIQYFSEGSKFEIIKIFNSLIIE